MRFLAKLLATVAAACLSAWAIADWSIRPYGCATAITDLSRRTELASETAEPYSRLRRIRANLEELHTLRKRCRTEVRVPMLIGANEELLGSYEEAVDSYRDALTVVPRPEIHTAIGDALIQLGRIDEAVEHYVLAARFNPASRDYPPSKELRRRVREKLGAPR